MASCAMRYAASAHWSADMSKLSAVSDGCLLAVPPGDMRDSAQAVPRHGEKCLPVLCQTESLRAT